MKSTHTVPDTEDQQLEGGGQGQVSSTVMVLDKYLHAPPDWMADFTEFLGRQFSSGK